MGDDGIRISHEAAAKANGTGDNLDTVKKGHYSEQTGNTDSESDDYHESLIGGPENHSESFRSYAEGTGDLFPSDLSTSTKNVGQDSDDAAEASNGARSPIVLEKAMDQSDYNGQRMEANNIESLKSLNLECFDEIVRMHISQDAISDRATFQVNSLHAIANRAAIVAEQLKAGLGRAHSAKERPAPWLTEAKAKPVNDLDSTPDHSSLTRAKSASVVTDIDRNMKQADRAAVLGMIGDLEAKAGLMERAIGWILPPDLSSGIAKSLLPYTPSEIDNKPATGSPSRRPVGHVQDPNTLSDLHRQLSQVFEESPIEEVNLIVPNTDDINLRVWTFRVIVLGVLTCSVITFLNTYFSYRTEPIVITITTALVAVAPLGKFMESVLPDKYVRIPGTQRGFSLNPGPFTMKEHALITIFSSAGSIRPGGIFVYTFVKVFLNGDMSVLPAFVLTLTCELFGYGWAVLLYKYFVEPAKMWWPGSIVNVSLIRGIYLDRAGGVPPLRFFLMAFIAAFAYYVLPGLLFPTLSTVSVVCLIFKHNFLAQQLGSGASGLGLGAVSFDWAAIAGFLGSPLVVPWPAVINIAVGFAIQAYVVAPISYWKDWFHSKNFPIFSSKIFTRSGQTYDVGRHLDTDSLRLSTGHLTKEDGLTYFSTFYTMSIGFSFALFAACLSQVFFFNGKDIYQIFMSTKKGNGEGNGQQSERKTDVHTKLMMSYAPLPLRWGVWLLVASHIAAIVNAIAYKDDMEIKWWGILMASALGAALIVPVVVVVGTTNQIPNLGIISQYIIGLVKPGQPVTNVVFRTYSTVVCGRTATYLGNFKLGHYMKIPPIATFHAQLTGTVISALVSTLVTAWLSDSINNICDTTKLPRNSPWTCPTDRIFYDHAITFGLIGPKRLFTGKGAPFKTLNYYFLPGFFLPIVAWMLRLRFPRTQWIRLINSPLLIRGAFQMPPSPVANNMMWIYVAVFFSFYIFHFHKPWWTRYNFVLSAALDAGTVAMALLQYYSLDSGKKTLMWWGSKSHKDHCPLASCPTAQGITTPGCPTR